MKRIRGLCGPTPGLSDYLDSEPGGAEWERFRNHEAGAAYRELVEKLEDVQHGLCGYCETNLVKRDRQVEHVVPRSHPRSGAARSLDAANLIACCKGGTSEMDDEDRRRRPVRRNRSCGEAKGASIFEGFVDPRELPELPSLTRVGSGGRIEVDRDACKEVGVPAHRVDRTIGLLGLNVERLRRARDKISGARWPRAGASMPTNAV